MQIVDSFRNLVANLGVSGKAKAPSGEFHDSTISETELVSAYRGSWLARKIVDIVPEDATREWRAWVAEKEQITALEEAERAFRLRARINEALRWARLFGGSAIVIGAGGENSEEPLNIDSVGRGGLRYLHVFTKRDLAAGPLEQDIESPNCGKPQYYQLMSLNGTVRLDPSRVVPFIGADRPPWEGFDGWGDSTLKAVFDALRNSQAASSIIAELLYEAKIDVVNVTGLMDALGTREGRQLLLDRFSLAMQAKSINNTLILDENETHSQKTFNFTGLPDIHMRFLQEAAGAADIPVTRLLGQSPAGLQSTGESDLRNYYDMIGAIQRNEIGPAIERIDEVLLRHALGARPEEIYYDWRPLWQMTPEQQAEVGLKQAQAFQIDVHSGVFDGETMRRARANQIIESGTYPGFEGIQEEVEQEEGEGFDFDVPDDPPDDE